MATKVVTKATGASDILGQARDMVARIREQAKEGEVDGALLDQLGGMLEVTADTASTPSDMASATSRSTRDFTSRARGRGISSR